MSPLSPSVNDVKLFQNRAGIHIFMRAYHIFETPNWRLASIITPHVQYLADSCEFTVFNLWKLYPLNWYHQSWNHSGKKSWNIDFRDWRLTLSNQHPTQQWLNKSSLACIWWLTCGGKLLQCISGNIYILVSMGTAMNQLTKSCWNQNKHNNQKCYETLISHL